MNTKCTTYNHNFDIKREELDLSVVILTYNEELNLEDCLKSVYGWVKNILIVDSYSTDKTIEIAKRYTNNIYQRPFKNHADQLNWALNNLPIDTKWVMRLDADERVTEELREELVSKLKEIPENVSGLFVKRRIYFMDKWIKYGDCYPRWVIRIWRVGKGFCEKKWMDEHIKVTEGNLMYLKNDIIDHNKKNLHWWINKHNSYATREAIDILNIKYNFLEYDEIRPNLLGSQPERKRWLKKKYANLPLFVRPFLYFIYRYIFKLGFLDGKEGLIWNFLQGFWYRFLVDAKIYEIEKKAKKENKMILDVIMELYNLDLSLKNKKGS